jgi:hypothetical protein
MNEAPVWSFAIARPVKEAPATEVTMVACAPPFQAEIDPSMLAKMKLASLPLSGKSVELVEIPGASVFTWPVGPVVLTSGGAPPRFRIPKEAGIMLGAPVVPSTW